MLGALHYLGYLLGVSKMPLVWGTISEDSLDQMGVSCRNKAPMQSHWSLTSPYL